MEPRRKVLSIVGPSRSGSTILSAVLGEVPGFFGAGELRWLWARDLAEQRVCGCQTTPAACPVWSRVVEQAMGVSPEEQSGPRLADALQPVVSAQREITRLSNRRRLLATPGADRRHSVALDVLTEATVSVVDALLQTTGAHTLIDESKRPQEAAVLAAAGRFDHYVVHLVRDPRAVVHSWRRAKPLPASTGSAAMPRRGLPKTLMRWLENCSGAEYLRPHIDPHHWLAVRYEDFAAHPRATVQSILDMLEEDCEAPFTSDDTVVLGPNHYLSGNPSRFRTGPVRIVADSEWQTSLPRRQRLLVDVATLPFLLRYGYPVAGAALRRAS